MSFLQAHWFGLLILCIVTFAIVYFVAKFRDRIEILGEFLVFLKERKLWWLTPIIVIFLLLGLFILFTEQSALAPLIYAIF